MTQTSLQFVDINGARLAYRTTGDDRSKPLLLTLHGGRGMGSHQGDFEAYSPLANICRVLSFDFRGHGQSSVTGPFTFAQLIDDIEAIRAHFAGNEPAIICGGSFGGMLAQQYAITYPRGTAALVLRGTAPSHHHEAEAMTNMKSRMGKAPMASTNMLEKVFGAFENDKEMALAMFALMPLYGEGSYDQSKGLAAAVKTVHRAAVHNDLYSEQEKYFDYRSRLPEVKVPTLIVAGELDWICPPDQSKIIHSLIPGSKLVIVPGANHGVHRSHNDEIIREIRQLVTGISPKQPIQVDVN